MHQHLFKVISRAFKLSMDHVIAPPFCAHCKNFLSTRSIFCIDCYEKIDPIVSVQIPITKKHSMAVLAISNYQEPLKSLILAKSWGDIVACDQLGQLIWQMTYFKHLPCDYLIPVPLHWLRYAKRGYNQAEEIANVLATYKNVPVANILKRVKNTPFQSSLAHDKRLANVKEAFSLKNVEHSKYHNKHLVLVDDLMTTGSTLAYSAKALLSVTPASLTAIVICRVV